MKNSFTSFLISTFILLNIYNSGKGQVSESLPVIPVGTDAYLMWETLPLHKIGIRAYMRSTYDMDGNNRAADASHFLYQESDSFNVILEVKGQGVLYFIRTNHFHGSPWHYEIDNEDFIVKETSTDDPINAKTKYKEVKFIPDHLFPNPLTFTWETTKGADLNWVPLGFEEHLRLAYSRTFYGTGYYIYHMIPPGTSHLSKPVNKWDKSPPSQEVLDLLNNAGTDILEDKSEMKKHSGKINLIANEAVNIINLTNGPSMIRSINLKVPIQAIVDGGKKNLFSLLNIPGEPRNWI
jgi:hypothetical protein